LAPSSSGPGRLAFIQEIAGSIPAGVTNFDKIGYMSTTGYKDTLDWYAKNAPDYAKKSKRFAQIDKQQLEEFSFMLQPGSSVLDAGCGSGRDTEMFRQKGFDAVGVDITKELVAQARIDYPQARFEEGDLLHLPFGDNSFDGLWAHASVVHFDQDQQISQALFEFHRVLKVNGVLHLLVRAQEGNAKTEVRTDSISQSARFYRNFTQKELTEILHKAGFNVTSVKQYNESQLDPSKRPGEGIEWVLALAKRN
jgi:ubiquinone/menaquinone biosynthesis C-methylase UbiE